jgi:phage terminase small subunit
MPRKRQARPGGLQPKQQRFVDEYLVDLNGTQAAIRAGYSPRTAQEQASRLLSNVMVAAAITAGRQAQSDRTGITADRVLQEIARLAFSDIRKLFGPDGRLKPMHELDDDTAAALGCVDVFEKHVAGEEDGPPLLLQIKQPKFWDKTQNLKLLAQHLGLLGQQEQELPDIHVHVHTARERVTQRLALLAERQVEDAQDGS